MKKLSVSILILTFLLQTSAPVFADSEYRRPIVISSLHPQGNPGTPQPFVGPIAPGYTPDQVEQNASQIQNFVDSRNTQLQTINSNPLIQASFVPFTISTLFYPQEENGPKIVVTVDANGQAALTGFRNKVLNGTFDSLTNSVIISIPVSGNTLVDQYILSFNKNGNTYSLSTIWSFSASSNGSSSQDTMIFSDNRLTYQTHQWYTGNTGDRHTRSNFTISWNASYQYVQIAGAAHLASSTYYERNEGLYYTTSQNTYYGYDVSGKKHTELHIEQTQDLVNGVPSSTIRYSASYTHEVADGAYTVTSSANTYGVNVSLIQSIHSANDYVLVDAYALDKKVIYSPQNTNQNVLGVYYHRESLTDSLNPRFIEETKRQNGVVYGIVKTYIVQGQPDFLSNETNDILLNPNQTLQGRQISYGKNNQDYGLIFKNNNSTVVIDYPRIKEVTLDGARYQVNIVNGVVNLTVPQAPITIKPNGFIVSATPTNPMAYTLVFDTYSPGSVYVYIKNTVNNTWISYNLSDPNRTGQNTQLWIMDQTYIAKVFNISQGQVFNDQLVKMYDSINQVDDLLNSLKNSLSNDIYNQAKASITSSREKVGAVLLREAKNAQGFNVRLNLNVSGSGPITVIAEKRLDTLTLKYQRLPISGGGVPNYYNFDIKIDLKSGIISGSVDFLSNGEINPVYIPRKFKYPSGHKEILSYINSSFKTNPEIKNLQELAPARDLLAILMNAFGY